VQKLRESDYGLAQLAKSSSHMPPNRLLSALVVSISPIAD